MNQETGKKEHGKSEPEQQDESGEKSPNRGFLGLLQSTLAAIFGIQSEKNRQSDFKQTDPSQFIFMGIAAVVVIVITMIVVVNSVLESAA